MVDNGHNSQKAQKGDQTSHSGGKLRVVGDIADSEGGVGLGVGDGRGGLDMEGERGGTSLRELEANSLE